MDRFTSIKHLEMVSQVRQSLNSGCHLCSLLWRCLRISGLADGVALQSARYIMKYSRKLSRFELELKLPDGQDRAGTLDALHGKIPSDLKKACLSYSDSLTTASTSSAACFELVSGWLYHCLGNLPSCSVKDEAPDKLPSRLLHLSMINQILHLRLCSVEPSENDDIHYLTLSHCWGKDERLTLTSAPLQTFMTSIPTDKLPLTFMDAIKIALKLGCEYLWIDSLCIIEDDEADWIRESANMGNIYRNGICNIAALGARNDHEGCFAERSISRFLSFSDKFG